MLDVSAHPADFHIFNTGSGAWLLHAGSHRLFALSNEAAEQLGEGSSAGSALSYISKDIELLSAAGLLDDINRECLEDASPVDGANLALNINLTSICNLGCTYCFAEGGDYGRIKGKLNTGSDLDAIIAFIRANTTAGEAVRLEFFGGEPMMNFDAIEALCLKANALAQETGIRVHHRISTNLTTRLTERELGLYERFCFTVSVSIDGGTATHDRNRPNLAGRGSFDAIIANCRKVRAQSEDITLVARMTYVPFPESSLINDVRELHALNIFDWFQILPAVVADQFLEPVFGEEFAKKSREQIDGICAAKVDAEYAVLAREYPSLFSEGNRFKGVLEIETIIRMILLGEVANGHCSGGRKYFTFSPDQSIMPCHRLVGETDFRSGSFSEGLDEATTQDWRVSVNDMPVCSECAIRYICSGGCKQENVVHTGDMNRPDPRSCQFQFRLVSGAVEAIGHAGPELRNRDRAVLRDLFVSCGRPTLRARQPDEAPEYPALEHLHPLT